MCIRDRVVIGYDTRAGSESYAREAAGVLSSRGIDVSLFNEPTPVPVVSFAIRYMKADGGIMITASHNPKEYNGYKVYDHFGNQIDDLKARRIEEYINCLLYTSGVFVVSSGDGVSTRNYKKCSIK